MLLGWLRARTGYAEAMVEGMGEESRSGRGLAEDGVEEEVLGEEAFVLVADFFENADGCGVGGFDEGFYAGEGEGVEAVGGDYLQGGGHDATAPEGLAEPVADFCGVAGASLSPLAEGEADAADGALGVANGEAFGGVCAGLDGYPSFGVGHGVGVGKVGGEVFGDVVVVGEGDEAVVVAGVPSGGPGLEGVGGVEGDGHGGGGAGV